MDCLTLIAQVINNIEQLIEDPKFLSELAGEDEGALDTALDFFCRLEDQFTPVDYVEEDPILWRQQQDQETD